MERRPSVFLQPPTRRVLLALRPPFSTPRVHGLQVRKYFPRAFLTRLEVEGRSEVAPLMNGLLDPLKALLAPQSAADPNGEAGARRILLGLFGSKLEAQLSDGGSVKRGLDSERGSNGEGSGGGSGGSGGESGAGGSAGSGGDVPDPGDPQETPGTAAGRLPAARIPSAAAASATTPSAALNAGAAFVPTSAGSISRGGPTPSSPLSLSARRGGSVSQAAARSAEPPSPKPAGSPARSPELSSSVPPTRARLDGLGSSYVGRQSYAESYAESESVVSDRDFASAEEDNDDA